MNGRQYTGLGGINLRESNGAIRFETPLITPVVTSGERVLYVNSSNELVFQSCSTSTVLGAAGLASTTPTLDGIFAGDKTLNVAGTTLTIENSTGDNNVLTLTNSGAGSGHALQITN